MISRIGSKPVELYVNSPKPTSIVPKQYDLSTLTSMQKVQIFSSLLKALAWVFYPLIWVSDALLSKVALTTEELEIFEGLLEGAFDGAAKFVLDRKMGEEKIREVIAASDRLYTRLTKKWFPNIEGIFFLRLNLIKIKMRACGALGDEAGVRECHLLMEKLDCPVSDDVQLQTKCLLMVSKPRFRWLIWGINGTAKVCFSLIRAVGYTDSDSKTNS